MTHPEPSLVLVTVWFGPLPSWMPAFLWSCRHNPGVQWRIFTDATTPAERPVNVTFLPLELEGFRRRACEALELPVKILPSYPYKACDLKIMFGRIFEPELRGFDFWGCCDLDILWGDIRRFMDTDILSAHDVITSRKGRISGHFCLFRNRPEWMDLYRRIPGISRLVGDAETYRRIDEGAFSDLLGGYRSRRPRRWWTHRIRGLPVPRVYWARDLTTSGQHQREVLADSSRILRWRDGHTYGAHGEELMYLHFHKLRSGMQTMVWPEGCAPREMVVTPQGISTLGGDGVSRTRLAPEGVDHGS